MVSAAFISSLVTPPSRRWVVVLLALAPLFNWLMAPAFCAEVITPRTSTL